MGGWMCGWMGRWVGEWVGGWVDGWMGGWVGGWMGGCMDDYNNYLNFWEEEINTSMKLDFYRLYKTGFCTSSYVDILRNTKKGFY